MGSRVSECACVRVDGGAHIPPGGALIDLSRNPLTSIYTDVNRPVMQSYAYVEREREIERERLYSINIT